MIRLTLLCSFPARALLAVTLCLAARSAAGATLSHQANLPITPFLNQGSANFPAAVIPRFNVADQCLNSVCVRLDGGITGQVGFENFQNFPVTVIVLYTGSITVQRPNLTTLVSVQPATTITDNLPVFDGTLDYGGLSGRSYSGVGATRSDSLCFTNQADLALFTGAGNISLPGFATDLASQTGASSWSLGVRGYGTVTVTYHYSPCATPTQRSTWGRIKSIYR